MGYETIHWDTADAVARLTLNRPERFNAFNATMAADLLDALERAATDESVRALLLTGAGRGFLAGQDLRALGEVRAARKFSDYLSDTWNPVVSALWGLEKPTVAAVNGPAIGAGVAVALACDLVLA